MINQADRLRRIFKDELANKKLGDTIGFAFEGPAYVPSPQGGFAVGYVLMVTLKHNVLVGQPDIGVSVPLMGILPPDDIIRAGAQLVLEKARELRHQASNPSAEEMAAADPSATQPVPPDLLGNGLSGSASQRLPAGFKATAVGRQGPPLT